MEFVPLSSFEFLNSLLHGVEAQGCLLTIRLEAFTCRSTRKRRQVAANMAQYANANTPPLAPAPNGVSPPPLCVGASPFAPLDPESIDERLVFLVAALNSIHGEDGYDFSVLTEADFAVCDLASVRAELDVTLCALPDACRPAVEQFWPLLIAEIGDARGESDCFRFHCPSCDPMATRALFSQHYFLYNRRTRLMVSLLMYAEGNAYRGDDGCIAGNGFYIDGEDETETETEMDSWRRTPDLPNSEENGGGKNRRFYYGAP